MPCTILVCRLCSLFPGCRRGERFDDCSCRSKGAALLWKPAGEIWVEGESDLEFVAKGFTVAFQTSMSTGEKDPANRSLGRSGEARDSVSKDVRRGERLKVRSVEGLKHWFELTHGVTCLKLLQVCIRRLIEVHGSGRGKRWIRQ